MSIRTFAVLATALLIGTIAATALVGGVRSDDVSAGTPPQFEMPGTQELFRGLGLPGGNCASDFGTFNVASDVGPQRITWLDGACQTSANSCDFAWRMRASPRGPSAATAAADLATQARTFASK